MLYMPLKRKKILFLITKSNWGGAQRYVYDLATGLDPASYEVRVALGERGVLAQKLEQAGIPVVSLAHLQRDVSIKKEKDFVRSLRKVLKDFQPDILHTNSSKAGAVGSLVGRLAGVPRVIFTAHGWAFNEDRPAWQRFIIKAIHYSTVLCAHATIAVSAAVKEQMNWPGAQRNMWVINPGRDLADLYNKTEAREKICEYCPRLRPHREDQWILTIAELHPIKQLPILIDALATMRTDFPNVVGVIIGDGELKRSLHNLITERNFTDTVFLVGHITEAARFLKAATVFALPSKSESYGYVLHEAGLAQVPIVATKVGGIPDIITSPEEGLLVPPGNTAAFTKAIHDTLMFPAEARARTDQLAKKLSQRTTRSMVTATTALYEHP